MVLSKGGNTCFKVDGSAVCMRRKDMLGLKRTILEFGYCVSWSRSRYLQNISTQSSTRSGLMQALLLPKGNDLAVVSLSRYQG